jgi:tetratricopeptide (TPR) repeat protein
MDPYLPQNLLLTEAAFSGRVLLAGRQPLLEPLVVRVACPADSHATLTGADGRFVIPMGRQAAPQTRPGAMTLRFSRCEFTLDAAGFEPVRKSLSHISSLPEMDLGTFTLKPLPGAVPSFSRTTAAQPPAARKQFFQALTQLTTGHGEAARQQMEALAAAHPGFAAAHYNLGRMHDALNRRDQALRGYQAAVEADPQYFPPLYQLVQMAIEDKRWPDALRLSTQVRALSPSHAGEMILVEAGSLFNLDRLPEADKLAREGMEREPRLHLLRGEIFSRYGNLEAALAHFRRYLELVPDSPDAEGLRTRMALLQRRPGS